MNKLGMNKLGMSKVRLSELTGGEAREVLARRPVILLPLGSQEDQGPHAPMGDYLSADAVAARIAAAATAAGTETLVAPVLPFGGADYFGTMPGGIALGQATLRAVLSDMFACLLRHDLDRLIVINGHGGNVQAIHDTTQEIYRAQKVLIPSLYLWRMAYALLPELRGKEVAAKSAGHGGDPLTSVAYHLFPDICRPDLAPDGPIRQEVLGLPVSNFGAVKFQGVEVQVPVELDELAPNGVWHADPKLCTAEAGAAIVDRLVAIGAAFVAHHKGRLA
jgi:creatinine amidohydrolase